MHSKTSLLIFFIILTTYNIGNSQVEAEFVNGGDEFTKKEYSANDEFFESLKPGETLAYWKEAILGYPFGPSFSNKVKTIVSDSLVKEVVDLEKEIEQSTYIKTSNITNKSTVEKSEMMYLESALKDEELLSSIRDSKKTIFVSLERLRELYSEAIMSNNFSDLDLLKFLLDRNIISKEDYTKILSSFEKEKELELSINAYFYILFLNEYNLAGKRQLIELDELCDDLGLKKEEIIYEMKEQIDLEVLESNVSVGAPIIELEKQVMQPYLNNLEGIINYNIKIINVGNTEASEIIIIDALPENLRYIATRIRGNLYKAKIRRLGNRDIVVWKLKYNMPKGDSCRIYFDTKIFLHNQKK